MKPATEDSTEVEGAALVMWSSGMRLDRTAQSSGPNMTRRTCSPRRSASPVSVLALVRGSRLCYFPRMNSVQVWWDQPRLGTGGIGDVGEIGGLGAVEGTGGVGASEGTGLGGPPWAPRTQPMTPPRLSRTFPSVSRPRYVPEVLIKFWDRIYATTCPVRLRTWSSWSHAQTDPV